MALFQLPSKAMWYPHRTRVNEIIYEAFNGKLTPETQKVKTFRLAEFHAQKLSGRSA